MEEHTHIEFDYAGFGRRLSEAIFPEKPNAFSIRTGVPQATLSKYLRGAGTAPRLDIAAHLARGAGVTLEWLCWGQGDGPQGADLLKVPRYAVELAAGDGRWNEARQWVEDIPFTPEFFRKVLNRTSANGLSILEARGDSMFPTIHDGAMVLVDERQQRITDGIFAFVLDGDARLKRFRRTIGGLTIISDNPAYPAEEIDTPQLSALQIIGQVLWVSQAL
jgi:transcriptional regulator with XRE-family HTH domain